MPAVVRVQHVDRASAVVTAIGGNPLKIMPTVPRGACTWVHTTTYGGGLLAGDEIRMQVTVDADARLMLATQASTKIYRSEDGRTARQYIAATVGAGGMLANLADPLTPFAGSRYEQETGIDLDPSASVVWMDAVTAGRSARGERWSFDLLSLRMRLRVDGRLILHDALRLDPAQGTITARMDGYDAYAALVVVGPALGAVRASIRDHAGPAIGDPDAPPQDRRFLLSIAPVGTDGMLVRMLADTRETLDAAIRRILAPVVPLLGDDPWTRRA